MSQNERGKSLITLREIVKQYHLGKTIVPALQGVDLDVARGEFTVVMGPSGSGKSSLLYLLGGLDRSTSGKITINEERLDQMDENALALFRRRTMGFIFQSYNLITSMNALENVAFPMQFTGIPVSERSERARQHAGPVGQRADAQATDADLAGQRQRLVEDGLPGFFTFSHGGFLARSFVSCQAAGFAAWPGINVRLPQVSVVKKHMGRQVAGRNTLNRLAMQTKGHKITQGIRFPALLCRG